MIYSHDGNSLTAIAKQIEYNIRLYRNDLFSFILTDEKIIKYYDKNRLLHRPKTKVYINSKDKMPQFIDAKYACFCVVGGKNLINKVKAYAHNYLSVYKQARIDLIIVPTEIGCFNESNNIIEIEKNSCILPKISNYLSSKRINKHIILDSHMLENISTNSNIILGIASLMINGIDLYLATSKKYPNNVDLPQQLYTVASDIMFNTLKYKLLIDSLNISILQKLSMIGDKCVSDVGKSTINALIYPLIMLGIDYRYATYAVGSTMVNKFIDASYAPRAKTCIKSLASLAQGNDIKEHFKHLTVNDVPYLSENAIKSFSVFLNNSKLKLNEEDIVKIYHNVIGTYCE